MRTFLAFLLLGVAASKEETCPILKWLEAHGKDAVETIMECKDVPGALKKALESECRSKPNARDMAAMAVWAAVTQMQHLNGTFPDMVKHSKVAEILDDVATKQLLHSTHKSIGNLCDHPECTVLAKSVTDAVAPCYGSLICNFMTTYVPFTSCKDAFQTYLETVMNHVIDSGCDSEERGGQKYYCSEMNADVMYKDMDCYVEYKSGGAAGCTPKCVKQWQAMSVKSPKCSKEFVGQTGQMYAAVVHMMQTLANSATDPNFKKVVDHMPKSLATYDATCKKVDAASVVV